MRRISTSRRCPGSRRSKAFEPQSCDIHDTTSLGRPRKPIVIDCKKRALTTLMPASQVAAVRPDLRMNMYEPGADTMNRPTLDGRSLKPYRLSPEVIPDISRVMDVLAIVIGSSIYTFISYVEEININHYDIFCFIFFTICYLAIANFANLFSINAVMRPISRADDVFVASTSSFLFLASTLYGLSLGKMFSKYELLTLFIIITTLIISERFLMYKLFVYLSSNNIMGKRIAVLGTGAQWKNFDDRFKTMTPFFVYLIGNFDCEQEKLKGSIVKDGADGDLNDLIRLVRDGKVDDIVVALPWNDQQKFKYIMGILTDLPVNVRLTTDLIGYDLAFRPVMDEYSSIPVFDVVSKPISGWSAFFKRVEDFVLSIIIIIAISPLLFIIAILIKIDSPGPVIFKQKRLGFNNNIFDIYKFRSMFDDVSNSTTLRQATRFDPRVTRVGRFIRSTSIDELPQLFNVLEGTMSLVGPRPHALSHNEEYGRQVRRYFSRHRVKPGITGWAQVNGLRGETEVLEKMEARVAHDIYYADNWSLFFDFKILIMTFISVLFQKNAY